MRGIVFPLILGIVGAGILCALGVWQLQRLAWKEGILDEISLRLEEPPISLPQEVSIDRDRYRRVTLTGRIEGPELHVLTSLKPLGPGFRVIRPIVADGRRLMVDLGFVPEADKAAPRPAIDARIIGNLLWPDETDGFTPEPNLERNIWFARETGRMAKALDAEPVLVVASDVSPDTATTLLPVSINVKNDHLEYAITWFSLMLVWIGMTVYLVWRIKRADAA